MSYAVGLDGARVELGPVDVRTQCVLNVDTAIDAKVAVVRGEIVATLYLGAEQVAIEVADPQTWDRIVAVAADGARRMRAELDGLERAESTNG